MPDNNQKRTQKRLQDITAELQELEKSVRLSSCAPRVLSEFRIAIDNIRQTAWAVQQWSDLQLLHRDPYTVLDVLSKERVRRATQIAQDLTLDLESLELSYDTEGLAELFRAVEDLQERLAPLFKRNLV